MSSLGDGKTISISTISIVFQRWLDDKSIQPFDEHWQGDYTAISVQLQLQFSTGTNKLGKKICTKSMSNIIVIIKNWIILLGIQYIFLANPTITSTNI